MAQSLQELDQRVDQIAMIFKSIIADQNVWNHLGAAKQQQLITGINKSFGQAMSFAHEFITTQTAETKGRAVVTQAHADVTIGQADQLFAKSIECKSVTKPEKGAVNKIVGDAIEQLGGQTGHNPRGGDVRIVDVKIDGNNNPWPLAGGAYGTDRAAAMLATIQNQAEAELNAIVNANKPGANAVRAWLAGENYAYGVQQFGRLRDVTAPSVNPIHPSLPPVTVKQHPHSTRPVYQDAGGNIRKVRCLTIKIRYEMAYLLTDPVPPNQLCGLSEIVVQVYNKPAGGLLTETAKVKKTLFDFSDPSNVQVQVVRA